ncbi:MAG: hypothetical protein ACK4YX_00955 [Rhabdaerophilum calidifontis]
MPAAGLAGSRCAGLLLLPLAAGAAMALRILERGETWNDRTHALIAIAMIGGLGGALAALALEYPLRRTRLRRAIAALLGFPAGFVPAMGLAFVAEILFISGHFEAVAEHGLRMMLFSAAQSFGLFLISAPAYLLPWPLPALTGLALALRSRRDG